MEALTSGEKIVLSVKLLLEGINQRTGIQTLSLWKQGTRLRGKGGLDLLDMKLVNELLLRFPFDRCLHLHIGL